MRKIDYEALEQIVGHSFANREYLKVAMTHSSYANEMKKGAQSNERGVQSNERQEFLGDAVLSIVVSDFLYKRFRMAEGDLTKLRAAIVCEKSLCEFARKVGLGNHLLLGKGEEQMGGADRPSILADAFEATIAAVYLDAGIEAARGFIIPFVEEMLLSDEEAPFQDYKTLLQEIVQQNPQEILSYVLVDESGPDHDKRFRVEVHLNSNVIGRGEGRSKKSAEQMAARQALELMGQIE